MSKLVENERVKLFAAALDRASTACLLIGVLGPMSAIYQAQEIPDWRQLLGLLIWFLAGFVLHIRAQLATGKLVE
jgi:hypothetical protein